jgi:hypothetical protein
MNNVKLAGETETLKPGVVVRKAGGDPAAVAAVVAASEDAIQVKMLHYVNAEMFAQVTSYST